MAPENVSLIVKEIIAGKLDVRTDEILPESQIKEDLGADSLDVIEIIMEIESSFLITIPDEEIESQDLTFQQVLTLVDRIKTNGSK